MAGKWHLSEDLDYGGQAQLDWLNHQARAGEAFSTDVTSYPVGRGFQHHYGPIWGVVIFFDPFSLVDGTQTIDSVPDGFYMTNAIGQKAVEYVNSFATEDKPFFLYVAHTAPHWPLHALPEDIAKYDGTYDDGWQAIRNARYARQLEMGLFDATNTPLPTTQGNDWNGLTAAQRLFLSNAMQTHAAMVDRVDQTVGDLILALKANGQFENTLIIFMSDNGASAEVYLNPGYDRPSETREGLTLE
jgi:arylsulfatase